MSYDKEQYLNFLSRDERENIVENEKLAQSLKLDEGVDKHEQPTKDELLEKSIIKNEKTNDGFSSVPLVINYDKKRKSYHSNL